MNYYDEEQEQYEEIAIQAIDNMPLGEVIEYSGNDVPVGWEKINDYSTTEVDTGKTWIDGKPIYRKVITGTLGSKDNWNTIPLSSNNIISISGFVNTGTTWVAMPRVFNGEEIGFYWDTTTIYERHNYDYVVGKNYTIIVEYTKTTD